MGLFHDERYPVAERMARRGFYLPSGMALTPDQIERAAVAARAVLTSRS
jgi:perosamine synthetase